MILVLQALKFPNTSININPYVLQIKRKIFQFQNRNLNTKLKFYWIPSHIGIEGNEIADNLAKRASETQPNQIKIPWTDIVSRYKKYFDEKTNTLIEQEGNIKGKHYFCHFYKRA